jgi:hypothetical protein
VNAISKPIGRIVTHPWMDVSRVGVFEEGFSWGLAQRAADVRFTFDSQLQFARCLGSALAGTVTSEVLLVVLVVLDSGSRGSRESHIAAEIGRERRGRCRKARL